MKNKLKKISSNPGAEYREETLFVPLIVLVAALLLIGAPLVGTILKINAQGKRAADASKYNVLIQTVAANVNAINSVLRNQSAGMDAINSSRKKPVVTLIIPEVVLVDANSSNKELSPLNIKLKGIYWNSTNPLVNIDNETYRVGDVVQGYTIVKIRKSSVEFRGKDGKTVVKDFYENLLQNNKK